VVGGLAGFGKTMLVAHLLGQLAPSPAVQFVLVDGKGGPDYDRLNPRAWLHAKDDLVYVRTQRGPRSRAWKAPPGSSSMPDARPMPQVRSSCSRPLLSVGDARCRCYGHAEGTAGEDQPPSSMAAMVTSSTGG
jgi:hypothetical protein